jgi:hypothetical protein
LKCGRSSNLPTTGRLPVAAALDDHDVALPQLSASRPARGLTRLIEGADHQTRRQLRYTPRPGDCTSGGLATPSVRRRVGDLRVLRPPVTGGRYSRYPMPGGLVDSFIDNVDGRRGGTARAVRRWVRASEAPAPGRAAESPGRGSAAQSDRNVAAASGSDGGRCGRRRAAHTMPRTSDGCRRRRPASSCRGRSMGLLGGANASQTTFSGQLTSRMKRHPSLRRRCNDAATQ